MKRGGVDKFSASEHYLFDRTNEKGSDGKGSVLPNEPKKGLFERAVPSKLLKDLQSLSSEIRQRYLNDVSEN